MTTQEERISRLEGACERLTTKADFEEVKAMIADLKAEITWRVAGLQLAGLAAVAAIMGFLR